MPTGNCLYNAVIFVKDKILIPIKDKVIFPICNFIWNGIEFIWNNVCACIKYVTEKIVAGFLYIVEKNIAVIGEIFTFVLMKCIIPLIVFMHNAGVFEILLYGLAFQLNMLGYTKQKQENSEAFGFSIFMMILLLFSQVYTAFVHKKWIRSGDKSVDELVTLFDIKENIFSPLYYVLIMFP